jgi:protein-S-isoprenylcysteine O-methyltransferase Ste14
MTMLAAGIGLRANAGSVLALLPLAVGIVQKGVIEREEAYLARRFPEAYPPYKARVRRWL